MRYTVTWLDKERDRLLEFWLASLDRGSITRAADAIDIHLRDHPYAAATQVTPTLYELRIAPLGVAYYIHDEDRRVEVVGVRIWSDN